MFKISPIKKSFEWAPHPVINNKTVSHKINTLCIKTNEFISKEKAQNLFRLPEQYGYQWIDLDEYNYNVNELNSIGRTPEDKQKNFKIKNRKSGRIS